ncbi:MAG: 50S ribosomal protein L16 [bacterium]|nr:50S ribosomal protein L16 [bacterium]
MGLLVPRRAKFQKQFRGRSRGVSLRGSSISFGEYGLQAQEPGWISSRQIEAARKAMTHYTKRGGRIWIRIFPDKPVSKKPPEVRMGGGKGGVEEYVFVVRPGRILFEMGGVPLEVGKEAMRLASHKIPVKTKFMEKNE